MFGAAVGGVSAALGVPVDVARLLLCITLGPRCRVWYIAWRHHVAGQPLALLYRVLYARAPGWVQHVFFAVTGFVLVHLCYGLWYVMWLVVEMCMQSSVMW